MVKKERRNRCRYGWNDCRRISVCHGDCHSFTQDTQSRMDELVWRLFGESLFLVLITQLEEGTFICFSCFWRWAILWEAWPVPPNQENAPDSWCFYCDCRICSRGAEIKDSRQEMSPILCSMEEEFGEQNLPWTTCSIESRLGHFVMVWPCTQIGHVHV